MIYSLVLHTREKMLLGNAKKIRIYVCRKNVYYVCIEKRIKVKGEYYGKFRVRNR